MLFSGNPWLPFAKRTFKNQLRSKIKTLSKLSFGKETKHNTNRD